MKRHQNVVRNHLRLKVQQRQTAGDQDASGRLIRVLFCFCVFVWSV